MRTIGLIGGTGWISTAEYYRIINEESNRRRGGLNFVKCILYSVDYGDIDRCNRENNRNGVYEIIREGALRLMAAGADCLVICANTLHQFADEIEKEFKFPLIHIAAETGSMIRNENMTRVGLLGTRQTMEMDFYRKKLDEFDIEVITPCQDDREYIQHVIDHEIMKSLLSEDSRNRFLEIIDKLRKEGAQGIILGCTEIPLLVQQEHTDMPLFNTLEIHACAAVDFALES